MAVQISAKQKKINREVEAISEKMKKTKIKPSDLIIPISIGVISLLLTIFVFVPMVTAALDYQQELKTVNEKIETLNKLNSTLESIDQNQISDDVITAKTVVPKILKVSDFIYYVDSLAKSKGLEERELSAGDTGSNTGGAQGPTTGVTGPVEYVGPFTTIISFLEEVQSSSPYLVTIKNVELSKMGSSNDWSVSLSVGGYYMADSSEKDINLYSPLKLYTDYTTVIEIFKNKAAQLNK